LPIALTSARGRKYSRSNRRCLQPLADVGAGRRGASCVFVGRPTLYAVAAAGEEGVRRAIEILRGKIDTTLGLIGCPDIAQLGPGFLFGNADTGPVLSTLRRTNTPVGG
jgi:FMN-dependent dehydrogenase